MEDKVFLCMSRQDCAWTNFAKAIKHPGVLVCSLCAGTTMKWAMHARQGSQDFVHKLCTTVAMVNVIRISRALLSRAIKGGHPAHPDPLVDECWTRADPALDLLVRVSLIFVL